MLLLTEDLVQGLKKLREAAGFGQYALARRVGMSRVRVQLAESGHVALRSEEVDAIN